jgi:hypothetical protein
MRRSPRLAQFTTATLLLGVTSWASAGPAVEVTATNIGGGLFEYDLVLDNTTGNQPLDGLDILHAVSVFGLVDTSNVSAPAGWMPLDLLPGLDELDYLSLDPSTDVPVGGSLGGFSFESTKDPATLVDGDFAMEAIGSDCACQIPIPGPPTAILLGLGLAGLGLAGCAKRRFRTCSFADLVGAHPAPVTAMHGHSRRDKGSTGSPTVSRSPT